MIVKVEEGRNLSLSLSPAVSLGPLTVSPEALKIYGGGELQLPGQTAPRIPISVAVCPAKTLTFTGQISHRDLSLSG